MECVRLTVPIVSENLGAPHLPLMSFLRCASRWPFNLINPIGVFGRDVFFDAFGESNQPVSFSEALIWSCSGEEQKFLVLQPLRCRSVSNPER